MTATGRRRGQPVSSGEDEPKGDLGFERGQPVTSPPQQPTRSTYDRKAPRRPSSCSNRSAPPSCAYTSCAARDRYADAAVSPFAPPPVLHPRAAVDARGRRPRAAGPLSRHPLVSVPDDRYCPRLVGQPPITCFRPEPFTTRGEARSGASYGAAPGWRTLTVFAPPDQAAVHGCASAVAGTEGC